MEDTPVTGIYHEKRLFIEGFDQKSWQLVTRMLNTGQESSRVVLGKPKRTIQASMYDKDKEKSQEMLTLGIPQIRIWGTHLRYGTTKSLSYYIRTRQLKNPSLI